MLYGAIWYELCANVSVVIPKVEYYYVVMCEV